MAPPGYQCLNVARQAAKKPSTLRAAFSTSPARRADDSPSSSGSSASSDLLSSLSPSSPFNRASDSARRPPINPRTSDPAFMNRNPIPDPNVANSGNRQAARRMAEMIHEAKLKREAKVASQASSNTEKSVSDHFLAQDYSKQITRRWRAGDVYAPHDLSGAEMAKWKKRSQPTHDVFDVLAFNPEQHYRNFSIMSEYMTPMGRIKHSRETGLRPVNQRRVARAIRRAIGLGMMPSVHRHPEILYKEAMRSENYSPSRSPVAPRVM